MAHRTVVFVAPFFMTATLRFVAAIAALPGVRLALISQSSLAHMPPGVRRQLAGHYQVQNALDAQQLADATRSLARSLGRVDVLLGALEHLQVQLGQVRDRLGIEGMGEAAARNFRDKARMKDVLQAAGLPCARHQLVRSRAEAVQFVRAIGLPVVLKPPAGAAAVGTFRVTGEAELQRALQSLQPSPERPAVIEEFM
ncbi:MAG: ATP-grasp domain-containing protein, partial [Planctomycetes bacterium]|nr:ATP-grasp domain-containing protein [Planctomycetota bacterium]